MSKEDKKFEESRLIEEQNRLRGVEDFPKSRKLKSPDGTIAYLWDNKLHNWEGPALIPEGDNRRREYYIYGIEYSEEEWKEKFRQQIEAVFEIDHKLGRDLLDTFQGLMNLLSFANNKTESYDTINVSDEPRSE